MARGSLVRSKELDKDAQIQIVRVEKVTDVVEEAVSFGTVTQKDDSLESGTEKVVNAGSEGKVKKHYEVILEDGEEVSRELVKEETVSESQDRVVAVGTKPKPGTFTPEGFVDRVNFDLANDLGNLLNRTVAMVNKYFDGEIPAYVKDATPFDAPLLELIEATVVKVEDAMEEMEFSVALTAIWQMVSRTNKYIDETSPWMLAKDEARREELGMMECLKH